jgi:crotonobetainyl-CoA:carnitine CoA-transferase CaiB-like acyl-CoA transferase
VTDLPLDGVRVLELGGYVAAPYATSLLAALGAEVVKVERPRGGDDFRRGADDRNMFYRQYNAGKKSLAVDLKHPHGLALVKALLPRFDVLVENVRPGKLSALGLGPSDCTAVNQDLVYASITGFGPEGAMAQDPSYDSIAQSFSGLYSVLSDAGSPQISGTCLADLVGALVNATGVLAALVGRGRTGRARQVETSLVEAVTTITVDAITQYFEDGRRDPSRRSRHPQAQNFALATADGPAMTIHLSSSERFWQGLVAALERPDLAEDPRYRSYADRIRNHAQLALVLEAEFLTRSADEWETRLRAHDVPHAPVLTISGFLDHPQTRLLDLVEPADRGLAVVRPPWRFDGDRPGRLGAAPRVGEHTRDVAGEVYGDEQIEQLVRDGVLFAAGPDPS